MTQALMLPHMPAAAAQRLAAKLSEARSYLEYGAGGSTTLAAQIGVAHIISVDSSKEWLGKVAADVAQIGYAGQLSLVHADLGPVKEWGYPVDHRTIFQWPSYYTEAWTLARSRSLQPDLALVDGRFRVACFLITLANMRPGTTILFDDYRDRPEYHGVEDFIRPVRMHDRMAEFAVEGGIDIGAVVGRLIDTRYVLD